MRSVVFSNRLIAGAAYSANMSGRTAAASRALTSSKANRIVDRLRLDARQDLIDAGQIEAEKLARKDEIFAQQIEALEDAVIGGKQRIVAIEADLLQAFRRAPGR